MVSRPLLLSMAERLGRRALHRRGATSVAVNSAAGQLHAYDVTGQGTLPTTVVLHGLGATATAYGPLLMRLSRHARRVVAPEFPGHGFSRLDQGTLDPVTLGACMTTAIDHLVADPFVLVGNSLGGAVALRYAIENPKRVRALVLISPAGAPSTVDEWKMLRSTFDLRTRKDGIAFIERVYTRPSRVLNLLAHEFPKSMGRRCVQDLLASASNDHSPTAAELASLEMPILLVWGKKERLLPESHFDYFAANLPTSARVERPDHFGHCPHFDAPNDITRMIADFVRQTV